MSSRHFLSLTLIAGLSALLIGCPSGEATDPCSTVGGGLTNIPQNANNPFSSGGGGTGSGGSAAASGAAGSSATSSDEECASGGTAGTNGTAGSGGSAATQLPTFELTVSDADKTVIADTTNTVIIQAVLKKGDGTADVGKTVNFTTSGGTLSEPSKNTDSSGVARVTLTSPTKAGNAIVTASTTGSSESITIDFVAGPATKLTLTTSPASVTPKGKSNLLATLLDKNNNPVSGQKVQFSFATSPGSGDQRSLNPAEGTTDANGQTSSTYTAGTDLGTDKISVGTSSTTVTTLPSKDIAVTNSAATISSITLATAKTDIVADGVSNTSVTATLKDSEGKPLSGITVNFTLTHAPAGASNPALNVPSAVTNSQGEASVTLTAGTRATVTTVKGTVGTLEKSTTVTVKPGPVATITIVRTPAGNAQPGKDVTLTATVTDSNNNTISGENISFTSSPARGTFTPASISTNAAGTAQVVYKTDSQTGLYTLFGRVSNNVTGTTSLTVDPGTVTSIAIEPAKSKIVADSSAALDNDNNTVITATVRDKDGNAPPMNTQIRFITSAGKLTAITGFAANPIVVPTEFVVNTDANGIAKMNLQSNVNLGQATVSALHDASTLSKSTVVDFVPGPVATVELTLSPTTVPVNQLVTLSAVVKDADNHTIPDELVSFTNPNNPPSGGVFTPNKASVKTGSNGVASGEYRSGATAGVVDPIRAATAGSNAAAAISNKDLTVSATASVVSNMTLTVTDTDKDITANGVDTTDVIAKLTSNTGGSVAGIEVVFSSTAGAVTDDDGANPAGTVRTDVNGEARIHLTSSITTATAIVNARTAGFSDNVTIKFSPGAASNASNAICGGGPVGPCSTLTVNPGSVVANGTATATVTALLRDVNGNRVADGTSAALIPGGLSAITTPNPTTTTLGQAQFTVRAPTSVTPPSQGETLRLQSPNVSAGLTYTAASTGAPASVGFDVKPPTVSIAGVGKAEQATITLTITDDAGQKINENGYNNAALNNVRVRLVSRPNGGEYLSGTQANSALVTTQATPFIDVRSSGGVVTLGFQSGTLPGVVAIQVQVLRFTTDGTTFATPANIGVTAAAPQLVIASGPPHTIVLVPALINAVAKVAPGVYERQGTAIVTDRFGNAVPDGTAINLGILDSIFVRDNAGGGGITLNSPTMVASGPAGADFYANGAANLAGLTLTRNNATRFIQPQDRLLLLNGLSDNKSRFMASAPLGNNATVTRNYVETVPQAPFVIGAALLGAEIFGLDGSDLPLIKGTGKVKDGLSEFRVRYPASHPLILSGCFGDTNDFREPIAQGRSRQVFTVASATDDTAATIDEGTFCFGAMAPLTLAAQPTTFDLTDGGPGAANDGVAVIRVVVRDNATQGEGLFLPQVPVSCVSGQNELTCDAATKNTATDGSGSVTFTLTCTENARLNSNAKVTFAVGSTTVDVNGKCISAD